MMNAPAWQSQRSIPATRPYSSDHFPLDSASPTGAGNGKWMQQVEYSRMLRSMQKGSSGDFVVPSETSATPTRLSSQRNVDLDELSPGIHDLHSFDTELLPELTEELSKVDEKLKLTKNLLETKNLEIKKINDEKKASMVVQFVAEATLRRVHAAQKDDDMPAIEAIFAPLEAELKLARQEVGICYEEAYAALNAAPLNQHFDRTRISHVQLLCLTEELSKVDEKLKLTKHLLETKNLEIKKINDEKKASMVVQFVDEATLRRVHAAQKDDDMPPI